MAVPPNSNPLVAQGTLNRIRGSIIVPAEASLNVTASYLGEGGIELTLEGELTDYIGTMTGAVTSGAPYMMVSLRVNLLRTQTLAGVYKARMEYLSTVGDITVIPNSTALPNWQVYNAAIESVAAMSFAGRDAGYVVTIKGYIVVNNALWSLL